MIKDIIIHKETASRGGCCHCRLPFTQVASNRTVPSARRKTQRPFFLPSRRNPVDSLVFRPLSQTQVSVPVPWAKPPDPSSLPIYCPEKSGALKLRDTLARSSCYIARSLRLARVTRPALRAATSGGGRPSWRVRSAPIRRFASFSLEFHGEPCALRRPWSLWLGLVHARPADRMGDRGLDSPGGSGN